jgi:hypothetical protein
MATHSGNGPSNGGGCTDLGDRANDHERVAARELELTNEERALLRDPEWMDEDEADSIMAARIESAEAGGAVPIREYMRERAARRAPLTK